MNYQRILYLTIIFDLLLIILLSAASFRFLSRQVSRVGEVNPQKVAQYNVILEVKKFFDISEKIKKNQ